MSKVTYQVEKIIGDREVEGKVQYRVHWTGYSSAQDSWEPESNLQNCKGLIKIYMDEKAAKTKRKSRKPETSAVLLSSNDEMDGSPKKARRGRPRKAQRPSASPAPVTTLAATVTSSPAKGVLNRSYDLRSSSRRYTSEIAFSSDEEEIIPTTKQGPVKPRMTLSESKFRTQLTETHKSILMKSSTPNKNLARTTVETSDPSVKTRLQFDTEKHMGVLTRSMVKQQQEQIEEADSFIAEAPPEEDTPTTSVPSKENETYPAWPEVGWKEFALAAFVTATAAVGYICYTTDLCSYC